MTLKVALGTGGKPLEGWINLELTPSHPLETQCDITKGLLFEDGSISFIHSENMLEHITYLDNVNLFDEIYRVLGSGGVARLGTHGLPAMVGLLKEDKTETEKEYVKWVNKSFWHHFCHDGGDNPVFTINHAFYGHGHKFLFDERTLRDIALGAGFNNIKFCKLGTSEHPELCGVEQHGKVIPPEFYELEVLIIEVTKE